MTDRSPTTPAPSDASATRRRWLLVGLAAIAGIVVAGAAVWFLFLGGDAPSAVDIDDAVGAVSSPSPAASAAASPEPSSDGSSEPSVPVASAPAGDGLDGSWSVDTSVGSFDDFSNSWVGFRVDEVLGQGIGRTTAVGRTPGVVGTLEFSGSTVETATIEADLTRIVSDRTRRDGAIQRSLETSTFPTATFVLTEPLDLGAQPSEGETLSGTAVGDLTIHGVTRPAEFAVEARLAGDVVVVVGSTEVVFSDFGVDMPSAPIVVSVEDDGVLELQLFFAR